MNKSRKKTKKNQTNHIWKCTISDHFFYYPRVLAESVVGILRGILREGKGGRIDSNFRRN